MTELCWYLCFKSVFKCVYFCALYSLLLVSYIFVSIIHCSNFCNFIVHLETRCKPQTFFFKIILAILGFVFPYKYHNQHINFYFKMSDGILIGIIFNLQINFGESVTLKMILSLLTDKHGLTPHLQSWISLSNVLWFSLYIRVFSTSAWQIRSDNSVL